MSDGAAALNTANMPKFSVTMAERQELSNNGLTTTGQATPLWSGATAARDHASMLRNGDNCEYSGNGTNA